MIRINLIPAPRLLSARAARRRHAWWRVLRVYVIFASIAAGAAFLPIYASGPSLDADLARVNRRIEAATSRRDTLQKQTVVLTQKIEAAKTVGEHPDWSLLLDTIARRRANEIVLESVELSVLRQDPPVKPGAPAPAPNAPKPPQRETFVFRLTGIAAKPASALDFVRRLEQLNLFDRVSLKDTHAQDLGNMPASHFEIEMLLPSSTPFAAGAK